MMPTLLLSKQAAELEVRLRCAQPLDGGAAAVKLRVPRLLGTMMARLGDHEGAYEMFRRSLEGQTPAAAKPHLSDAHAALDAASMGAALGRLGKHVQGADLIRRALEVFGKSLDPSQPLIGRTLAQLAMLELEAGDLDVSSVGGSIVCLSVMHVLGGFSF